jgi:hypothetical protein
MGGRMTPTEYVNHIEAEASRIVADVAQETARQFQASTPTSRKRTQAAVFHRTQGTTGRVGLDFKNKYQTAGTDTKRHFRRTWRRIRPAIEQTLLTRLTSSITGN